MVLALCLETVPLRAQNKDKKRLDKNPSHQSVKAVHPAAVILILTLGYQCGGCQALQGTAVMGNSLRTPLFCASGDFDGSEAVDTLSQNQQLKSRRWVLLRCASSLDREMSLSPRWFADQSCNPETRNWAASGKLCLSVPSSHL